ncbi:MAG: sensor histidine kinase [Acidobacteriales bacterium]|nr:sensor histidine kinase [Terriglobales bacterium]
MAAFEKLEGLVDSYWKSLAPSLEWSAAARRARGEDFLREVVIPRRVELVELVRQVTALNERDLDAREERLEDLQTLFRRRMNWVSAVALLLGVILALVIIFRVRHLERVAALRYAEVEEARRNLRRLSDRLVTAQEDERRSISRELHDQIGQAMSASLVELGRLEAAPADTEAHRERLASIRRVLETCVGMVCDMALLLRPSMLDDLGLVAALKWQAREVARRTGLNVKMVTEEITDDLPDSHRTCLYRVVQEALNNCAKYSHASQVRVIIRRDENGLSVSVQDDGIGFDPKQEKGLGILGMEERIAHLGGLFCIESKPGQGTVLSIRFPISREQPVVGNGSI